MAYRNLDEFIVRLETARQVRKSKRPLRNLSDLPIDQKTLWVESDDTLPLVTRLFNTETKMAWALGAESLALFGQRFERLFDPQLSNNLMGRAADFLGILRTITAPIGKLKTISVQHHIHIAPKLPRLPFLSHGEGDYLFGAQLVTPQGVTSDHVRFYQSDQLGVPFITKQSEPIPIAIVLGGDPAQIWSSMIPLPQTLPSYFLANWIRGQAIPLAPAHTIPLDIPANAEIVIEGWLDPSQTVSESIYDPQKRLSGHETLTLMQVTAITHRDQAVCPMISADDRHFMQQATKRLFLPILKLQYADIVDLQAYFDGDLIIVRAHTTHAQKILFGLWGTDIAWQNRMMMIVPESIPADDLNGVIYHLFNAVNWGEALTVVQGRVDPLLRQNGIKTKIGIDATQTIQPSTEPSARVVSVDGIRDYVWCGTGLLLLHLEASGDPETIIKALWASGYDCNMIVCDQRVDLAQSEQLLHQLVYGVMWQEDIWFHQQRIGINATAVR
ncbi:MAG: UbiD family decarboxylase [Anaerolineae bacterium]|nr:UbiD family decarboxylase [Anaerolineae bacterium]